MHTMQPSEFTQLYALDYVDLKQEKKYCGKTCNDTVGYLKTIFFMLLEREIMVPLLQFGEKNGIKGVIYKDFFLPKTGSRSGDTGRIDRGGLST